VAEALGTVLFIFIAFSFFVVLGSIASMHSNSQLAELDTSQLLKQKEMEKIVAYNISSADIIRIYNNGSITSRIVAIIELNNLTGVVQLTSMGLGPIPILGSLKITYPMPDYPASIGLITSLGNIFWLSERLPSSIAPPTINITID
jgi:hypothetical protein